MSVPNRGKQLYSALMFLVVSVLGGLLAAGLIVPTAGVAAELAKTSAYAVQSLPEELETPPQPEGSKVLMKDGTLLTNFFDQNRTYVELENIAPIMQKAQIAVEDQRFYEHGALDLRGTVRALVRTVNGNTQGGSTLTQQYVKLVLLNMAVDSNDTEAIAAAQKRTFARKMLELRYAIAIEEKLSKDEILERYLNLSYFGGRAYGVEAAARHYFNTSAKKLTLPQAAMLAGLVRNPSTTDPVRYEKLALERRNNVLDVMAEVGTITKAEAQEAKKVGFDQKKVQATKHGCANSKYPHLCVVVEKTLLSLPSMGASEEARRDLLNRGGLTIKTEIDPRFQDAAQKAVSAFIKPKDPVIGVMVMIEPGTGLIKAAAQSRPVMGNDKKAGEDYYAYFADGKLGGAEGYQGGSTFKAFTLAAALEKGIPTSVSFDAPKFKDYTGEIFRSCEGPFRSTRFPVMNAGGGGYYNMYEGTRYSSNNFFVQLEQMAGLCETVKMAEKLGLKLANPKEKLVGTYDHYPSFTLGAAEITPLSLANAYATFAARGKRCDPIIIKSATAKDGHKIDVPDGNCQQVIPESVADTVNDVLRGPFGPGGTARAAAIPGYQLAGKTGTETRAPTIWTIGYTANLAGAAMITVDKQAPRFKNRSVRSLRGTRLESGYWLRGSSGGEAGVRLWKPAMTKALSYLPKKGFKAPSDEARYGKMVDIPSCVGMGLESCRARLVEAGFSTRVSRIESSRPEDTFLGISPRGTARQYSVVRLLVSDGPRYVPPPKKTEKPKADDEEGDPAPAEQPAKPNPQPTKPGKR